MKSRGRSNRRGESLSGKKILLIVTGGISAYKSAFLVRIFTRAGAEVRVVMSGAAAKFVTPLTFEVLSGNPVPMDMFARRDKPRVEHVELGSWPDRILVAPATADFISKAATGAADDLPSTIVCAASCEVIFAPAMNDRMWSNPAVRRNIEILRGDGKRFIDPAKGELACGTSGSGRMAEPEEILAAVEASFAPGPFAGVKVLVTAGRTEEEIDPVRYISNRSSGRMGFALAAAAKRMGAHVTLIHGAVDVEPPQVDSIIRATTASRMKASVKKAFPRCDILIMAAAVADYRPAKRAPEKIKKSESAMSIELRRTADILESAGSSKRKGQIVVGFALESGEGEKNAVGKGAAKGCDYVVLNLVGKDTGFGVDTNQVTLYRGKSRILSTPVVLKEKAAEAVLEALVTDGRIRKAAK